MADPPAHAADAAAACCREELEERQQQAEGLQEQVYRRVLSSSVMSSVKAYLRAQLYAELKGPGNSGGAASAAGTGWKPLALPPSSPSLRQHVLNCILSEYLQAQQYRYTLSVFLAESGSNSLPSLCRGDILRLIGVLPETRVHSLLTRCSTSGCDNSRSSSAGSSRADCVSEACASLAEAMVEALGSLGGSVVTRSSACQTRESGEGGCGGAAPTSHQLMQRLESIEEQYQHKRSVLEQAGEASLAERMAAYQRECDLRCAAQLEERLGALRKGELAAAREEEEARCRQRLEADRLALQQADQERQAQLHTREEELSERRRKAAAELDLAAEEHLRRMRADEERLAAWKVAAEAKLAAAQSAAELAGQQAEAAERRAQQQEQEAGARLAAREREVQAREAEALRQQAKAEAELGRVAGLQLQLAAALEDVGGLRQQLAGTKSSNLQEQAELSLEVETLRRDNEKLQAAAAGTIAAHALSPDDASKLRRAVQRLLARVRELQGEVAACRHREQLWKAAATDAGKLLDKSLKGQDLGLSHAEELRLSLAAAAREVLDLQQQAALAAAGIEGPSAATLAAACSDARQWAEAAGARVDAAKEEEQGLRQRAVQLRQRALANRTAVAEGLQRVLHAYEQASEQQQTEDEGWDEVEALEQETKEHLPKHGFTAQGGAAAAPVTGRQADSVAGAQGQQRPSETPPSAAQQQQQRPQQQRQHRQLHRQQDSPVHGTSSRGGNLWDQYQAQQQQQQQQQSSLDAVAKPPTRTASDILAAYRARQHKACSEGHKGGLGSRGSSESQEAASGDEAPPEAAGTSQPGAAALGLTRASMPPEPAAENRVAGRGVVAADGDSYYVSDLTSDDSSRF